MNILLTGASGFIGSHLSLRLIDCGHQLIILKRSTSDTSRIEDLLDSASYYDVDKTSLEKIFNTEDVDVIIHSACDYGRGNSKPSDVYETNLLFPLRLLEAAKQKSITNHFINLDSFFNNTSVSSQHLRTYTLSKKAFNEWLAADTTIGRRSNLQLHHVYGPNDNPSKFVPWLCKQIVDSNAQIDLSPGEQTRDFIYIDDVVNAITTCLETSDGQIGYFEHEVCTGVTNTLKTFVETLFTSLVPEADEANRAGRLCFGKKSYAVGEIMHAKGDNSSLLRMGWKPVHDILSGCNQFARHDQF